MPGKPRVAKQVKEEFDLLGLLVKWARVVVQIALFFFVISAGYLLYGIFSGALSHQADARVVENLRIMGQVLTLSSFLGALAFCFLTIDEIAYAVLIGLVGAGLVFGIPVLVASNVHGSGSAGAAAAIQSGAKSAGMAVLAIVGLRFLFEIIQQILMASERRRAKAEREAETGIKRSTPKPTGGLWSPCWGLPYCHEAVREQCPAYRARKSCWRFGYGCNCDPSLIERLIRAGAVEAGRGAAHVDSRTRATHEAYVRSDLQADRTLKPQERTIPCSKCPIYLEHQRQKFKIVNPIAVIACLAILVAAYRPLLAVYREVIRGIAQVASRFTYGTRVDAGEWFEYLNTPAIQIFFFVIVGMLALAYVLKFVEWVIFEKKL